MMNQLQSMLISNPAIEPNRNPFIAVTVLSTYFSVTLPNMDANALSSRRISRIFAEKHVDESKLTWYYMSIHINE